MLRGSHRHGRLDVDDRAGAEGDGRRGVGGGFDGLVQADGGAQQLGQCGVLDHVVVGQRLFDQQQAEVVELGELPGVRQGVGGVGVDLEEQLVTVALADGAYGLDVPARLDLQLDPDVALGEIGGHGVEEFGYGAHDADRDAARNPVPRAPRQEPKDSPAPRSWASSTAVSSAALAMRWPVKGCRTRPPRARPRRPSARPVRGTCAGRPERRRRTRSSSGARTWPRTRPTPPPRK